MELFLAAFGLLAGYVLPCKTTVDGRNVKHRQGLSAGGLLTEAFHKFSRSSKIGVFRPYSPASYLPYSPLCPQWLFARKTVFPTKKLKGASQKGKVSYADKKNDCRARPESGHKPLSQLPQERKRQGHETAVLRQ